MAVIAIDDQCLAIAQQAPRIVQADDRRNAHAARQNRGVRQRSAVFGNERHHVLLAQQNDVGGRDVIGDDDRGLGGTTAGRQLPVAFHQHPQDAVGDVFDVVAAGLQIGVIHLVEDRDQCITLVDQRLLGVAALVTDHVDHRVVQRTVVDHQQMRVYEGRDLGWRPGRNLRAHLAELLAGALLGPVKAGDLMADLIIGQLIFGHLQIGAVHALDLADGHAAGYAYAGQPQAHGEEAIPCAPSHCSEFAIRPLRRSGP